MLPDSIRLATTHFWQIVILIGLVWIICHAVARRRAHLAHLLWLVVILKCLTPPVWSSHLGIFCWMRAASTYEKTPSDVVPTQTTAIAPTIVFDRTRGMVHGHTRGIDESQVGSDVHRQIVNPHVAFNVLV